jgi:hypothetical protein
MRAGEERSRSGPELRSSVRPTSRTCDSGRRLDTWPALRVLGLRHIPSTTIFQTSVDTRAPHFTACCQTGRRREASSGLSFGVNAGLRFLRIAGWKFPGSDVRFGRQPHNRDLARATRTAKTSILPFWCPLLTCNAPLPSGAVGASPTTAPEDNRAGQEPN